MYTQGKVADLGYRSATLFSSVLVWDTMEITTVQTEYTSCLLLYLDQEHWNDLKLTILYFKIIAYYKQKTQIA